MRALPVDALHYEIVKLKVGDLRKGMFVCQLDKPWEDSPFMFEGFEIETDADLEAVRKHCEFVYIDLGRTQVVRVKIDHVPESSFFPGSSPTPLDKEIETAEVTKSQTSNLVKTFQDEVKFGRSLDMGLAKSAVAQCVASIMRNPDAMMLLTQIKEKSIHTSEHAFNVCIYSIILGRLLGYDAQQLEEIGTCGLLHDIGNIEIPAHILNKKDALTPEEYEIIKRHTIYGRDILMSARNIYAGAVDVAYCHHECLDGSGYPRGVTGKSLNQNSRIVAVVDRYGAIIRNTVYRSAINHLDAVNTMNILAENKKIDPKLNSMFVSYLGFYPPGTIVELSSGEIAIVLKTNPKQRLKPQVLIVRDLDRNPAEKLLDLATQSIDERGKPYKIKMVHLPGYLGIELSSYFNALIDAYD